MGHAAFEKDNSLSVAQLQERLYFHRRSGSVYSSGGYTNKKNNLETSCPARKVIESSQRLTVPAKKLSDIIEGVCLRGDHHSHPLLLQQGHVSIFLS